MTIDRISKFLADYAAGERDFRGIDLSRVNLAGAFLYRAYLEGAILKDANLEGADLDGAYLAGADLSRANLYCAILAETNLEGAILKDANLEGANLRRANLYCATLQDADLRDSDLELAILEGANLTGANLSRVNLDGADLDGANLAGAIGLPEIEPFPIDTGIAEAVGDGVHLDMDSWHSSCGTAHCRAGWAVTLHPQGKKLEDKYGTNAAAALIYKVCSISERTPNWFADNADALADIRRLAALAAKVVATPDDVKGTP
jgi:hypothetical protein